MLRVAGLNVALGPERVPVVRSVDLAVNRGEILGLVGESGSGKSMTCLALMRLLPADAQVQGRIAFDGEDLLALDEAHMVRLRGRRIAMVFQDPIGALNPIKTIGWQIREAIRIRRP